jgi:lipopolysaccharide/colanic/teichoic acid biosynthesis glycosyltransferase
MFKKLLRQRSGRSNPKSPVLPKGLQNSEFLPEEYFLSRLRQEQKRTERSRRPFVLMLLESPGLFATADGGEYCDKLLSLLSNSIRETDTGGWYRYGSVVGIIFTEISAIDRRSIAETLSSKIGGLLEFMLGVDQANQVKLSFHVFPEDWDGGHSNRSGDSILYPKLSHPHSAKKASLVIKRAIDISGSACALILGSPVLAAIAIAIKLTSTGPVLFRQRRVGRYGNAFTFLKFRSMYVGNNQAIHQEYVKSLIEAPQAQSAHPTGVTRVVYKLTNDPRVTSVGKFLRKTSLDELPQFLNVLNGEMSLVGPRPPIPYEVESYDVWHRRRLLEVKPGITGLWQVMGRSRTTFDDMVRLDLEYATSWSLWLDIKILLKTPMAVFAGDGAY